MNWTDPAAVLAVLIWVGTFGLLFAGYTVPSDVWVAASLVTGFFYAGHVGQTAANQGAAAAQAGSSQLLTALNGGSAAALVHAAPAPVTPPAPTAPHAPPPEPAP